MKLFMVIYIAGRIGGSVGPLPYGMEECQERAAEQIAKGKADAVTPEGYTLKDVNFVCEWHDAHPQS